MLNRPLRVKFLEKIGLKHFVIQPHRRATAPSITMSVIYLRFILLYRTSALAVQQVIAGGAVAAGEAVVDGAKAAGGAVVDGASAAGGAVVDGAKAVGGFVIMFRHVAQALSSRSTSIQTSRLLRTRWERGYLKDLYHRRQILGADPAISRSSYPNW
uniref:Uncharacterized protein n=1 Tax=Caenorhabditis tropicalis TaxID=1561998 RepID=A0A1I7UIK3_9PELO